MSLREITDSPMKSRKRLEHMNSLDPKHFDVDDHPLLENAVDLKISDKEMKKQTSAEAQVKYVMNLMIGQS